MNEIWSNYTKTCLGTSHSQGWLFYVVLFPRQREFLLLSTYSGLENTDPEVPGLPLNGCDQGYSSIGIRNMTWEEKIEGISSPHCVCFRIYFLVLSPLWPCNSVRWLFLHDFYPVDSILSCSFLLTHAAPYIVDMHRVPAYLWTPGALLASTFIKVNLWHKWDSISKCELCDLVLWLLRHKLPLCYGVFVMASCVWTLSPQCCFKKSWNFRDIRWHLAPNMATITRPWE